MNTGSPAILVAKFSNPSNALDSSTSSSLSNGRGSEEEHFEFSPDFRNGDHRDQDNQDNSGARLMSNGGAKRDLSSDSFRSTSSASSLGNNFSRNNHHRQSLNQRNSWARSSLRRTGSSSSSAQQASSLQHNGSSSLNNGSSKRLSANAHASQMFRGNSPGSRRSSMSPDELANDPLSLEDDVIDLTQKIENLQQQVTFLHESQTTNDDRYVKVKQENASLLSKIHSLEEQLRDIEVVSEERRKEEERRFKETIARHEREKSFECEQYINRVYSLQQELLEARDETRRFQALLERRQADKIELEAILEQKTDEIETLTDELNRLKELSKRHRDVEIANGRVIDVLNQELDELRQRELHPNKFRSSNSQSDHDAKLVYELEQELRKVKTENKEMKEANEELQATLLASRLEEGRSLLKEQVTSLAEELGSLTEDQMRRAMKEMKDENINLRAYIDDMLLNIVDNYPQLLEKKPQSSTTRVIAGNGA